MGLFDRVFNRKQYAPDEASITLSTQGTGFAELPVVAMVTYCIVFKTVGV